MELWDPNEEMIERIGNLTVNYNSSDFDNFWGENNQIEQNYNYDDMDIDYPDSDDEYHHFSMEQFDEKLENLPANKRINYDNYIDNKKKIEKERIEKIETGIKNLKIEDQEDKLEGNFLRDSKIKKLELKRDTEIKKVDFANFKEKLKKFKCKVKYLAKESPSKKQKFSRYKNTDNDDYLKFRQYKQNHNINRRKFLSGSKAPIPVSRNSLTEARSMNSFMRRMEPNNFMLDNR